MNASLKDLIMSLYDLTPLEFDLLFTLIARKKAIPLDVLSKEVDRDKTTVFRYLQKLVNLRICEKDTKTLKEGGLYHVYTAIDIAAFKMETEKRVNEIKESFDSLLKKFEVFSLPSSGANVRQILGRSGEVWGAESGTDKLVVIRSIN
jgi:predicted transcriptional regulator